MSSFTHVPYSALRDSKVNVRRVAPSKAGIRNLAANIKAVGVLQNLIVVKCDDAYEVIGGKRRLMALSLLRNEKHIEDDYPVPVRVAESVSTALSLAENVLRESMHPVDECDAYLAMKNEGQTVESISVQFGVTARYVNQRLKLSSLHPALRNACRKDQLSLDALMAFTVCDDQGRQLEVWDSIKNSHRKHPDQIRRALLGEAVKSTDPRVRWVGLATYKQAGGAVAEDMFENCTFIADEALLDRLATEKLEKKVAALQKEGWKWVEGDIDVEWNTIHRCSKVPMQDSEASPAIRASIADIESKIEAIEELEDWSDETRDELTQLEAQLDTLQQQLDDSLVLMPESMAVSGCIVGLDSDGKAFVQRGLIKPQDRREAELRMRNLRDDSDEDDEGEGEGSNTAPEQESGEGAFSRALLDDLDLHAQAITKLYLADDFTAAFDLMLCNLIADVGGEGYGFQRALESHTRNSFTDDSRKEIGEAAYHKKLIETVNKQLCKLGNYDNTDELFDVVTAMPIKEKQALFAALVAVSYRKPVRHQPGLHAKVVQRLNVNYRAHWLPTADNLFSRVAIPHLKRWCAELLPQQQVESLAKATKKTLVDALQSHFRASHDSLDSEAGPRREAWLPKEFL